MGLFSKTFCCLCGKKTNLLMRQKLVDGQFLCSACQDKCSPLISYKTYEEKIRKEDMAAVMEDHKMRLERCAQFQITTALVNNHGAGILVDETHGWWVSVDDKRYATDKAQQTINEAKKLEVMDLDQYRSYTVELGTFDQDLSKYAGPTYNYDKVPRPRPDFPVCESWKGVDEIAVIVHQDHPFIECVKIADCIPHMKDVLQRTEDGYKMADQIITLFEQHQAK